MRLTLTGKLERVGDTLALTLDDVMPGPQKLAVIRGESKKEADAKSFEDAYARAQGLAGKAVEIEGYWKPADKKRDKAALPTLAVIGVKQDSGPTGAATAGA